MTTRTVFASPWAALGMIGTFALSGCATPSEPTPAPEGGNEYVLDYAMYAAEVAPVLEQYGCHAAECHGGGIRGTFELSPEMAPDPAFDFDQVALQVNPTDPDASPILRKPLAHEAGGELHQVEPFDSTEHAGYVAIRDWILAGEFQ